MPKRKPGLDEGDEINQRFGARLRLFREMTGHSQTDVGDALGVSFQQIQKYENGRTSINLNRLQDVANFLRVPMMKLLDGLQEPTPGQDLHGFAEPGQSTFDHGSGSPSNAKPFSKQNLSLLTAFTRIDNPKTRRAIVSLVETIGEARGENEQD